MITRFDRSTAVRALPEGGYEAVLDRGYWIVAGPNGGYLAAIMLRTLMLRLDDAARAPRSLTIHYLRRPVEGPVTLQPEVERSGRTLSTLSLRMLQGGKLMATALAAFATERAGTRFADSAPPSLPPPERCPRVADVMQNRIPMHALYDARYAPGALPFSGGAQARVEGYVRAAEPRPFDPLLVAAFTDALPPALFSRKLDTWPTNGVPTVDLTIHFRGAAPEAEWDAEQYCSFRFLTRVAASGFVEEDGEIWSPSGVLLAQSRQLAIVG
jgi:acyl-CoA thioesterase